MEEVLLGISLKEGTGIITHDWAKPHHPTHLINTPTWSTVNDKPIIELDGTSEQVLIYSGDAVDLDFTSEDFSIDGWFLFDAIGTREAILNHGIDDLRGYALYKDANDAIVFETYQAAATQQTKTADGAISASTWYYILVVRDGASVRIYINGVDETTTAGTHIDPATTTRQLNIGRA